MGDTMTRAIWFSVALLTTCVAISAAGTSATNTASGGQAAVHTNWQVYLKQGTKAPNLLRPRVELSIGSVSTDEAWPRAGAQFFRLSGDQYGLRPGTDEMVLTRVLRNQGMSFLKFQQVYRGIPVLGGDVSVAVDSQGRVHMASGSPIPGITEST